ncbi:hypothetical protein OH799_15185 [Nocardia sp. NBC_00881]|uniref:hypothetical protein n=1 Tax=Nocardia sp. NBC_00881 TaxID=2975995 RepID=UPI003863065D|nr:hypothetical protein OH799_15185 [Nocardia sp. NBC_00881]
MSDETHTTERDGVAATWFIDSGVIRVVSVQHQDGTTIQRPGAPSLGECFGLMPRTLWDRIRYEYESPGYETWPRSIASESPRPDERDIHLSVRLHDARMDFAACFTAALVFMQDWQTHHGPDAVAIVPGDAAGLPRLPNERLYLEP